MKAAPRAMTNIATSSSVRALPARSGFHRGQFIMPIRNGAPNNRATDTSRLRSMTVTDVTSTIRPPGSHRNRAAVIGLRPTTLERVAQPLQFETGAKQREQARHKDDPALNGEQNVGLRSEIGEMPEDHDGKQC